MTLCVCTDNDDIDDPGMCDPMWSCILQDYEDDDEGYLWGFSGPYERFRRWRRQRAESERLRQEQKQNEAKSLRNPVGWERVKSIDLSRIRSYRPFRRNKE